jgi:ribosome recycling factor
MTQEQKSLLNNFYSDEYRHECELRYIASMNLSGRRKYLALVLDKRGVKSLEKLKEGLTELWTKKKQ